MTTSKYNEKIKCEKCDKIFCFRVYRYKHFNNCNGIKSYGNIFDNPNQPIRKYGNSNISEEFDKTKETEKEQTNNTNEYNINYKFIKPIKKDNNIIKRDYSNLKLF